MPHLEFATPGDWQQGLRLLLHAAHRRLLDVVTFSSAISACEKAAEWQNALELLRYMSEVEAWGQVGRNHFEGKKLRTCCACTCKDYVCKHSQPKWHCHFGSRAFVHVSEKNLKGIFLPTPSICATAMSDAPVSFDRVIPEETQGPMPVEAPTTLASGSLDSFHHVEAVLKDDNVSTGTLDDQDWEMVTEMVEDTDNAATHFLQGKHVIDLDGPAPNLQDSIDTMMATMEKMKLGSTADGVEAPSRPEGVASAAAVPAVDAAPMDDSVVEQTTHKWKVFGRGTPSPTFILAEVPFSMGHQADGGQVEH